MRNLLEWVILDPTSHHKNVFDEFKPFISENIITNFELLLECMQKGDFVGALSNKWIKSHVLTVLLKPTDEFGTSLTASDLQTLLYQSLLNFLGLQHFCSDENFSYRVTPADPPFHHQPGINTDAYEAEFYFRRCAILLSVSLFLNIFLQVNCTGPPLRPQRESQKFEASETNAQSKVVKDEHRSNYEQFQEWPRVVLGHPDMQHGECVERDPGVNSGDAKDEFCMPSELLKGVVLELEIDGEMIHDTVAACGYLWAAWKLLDFLIRIEESPRLIVANFWDKNAPPRDICQKDNISLQEGGITPWLQSTVAVDRLESLAMFRSRICFVWHRILVGGCLASSPNLINLCVNAALSYMRRTHILPSSFKSPDVKAPLLAIKLKPFNDIRDKELDEDTSDVCHLPPGIHVPLLIELALHLAYFGKKVSCANAIEEIGGQENFSFELTGAMGRKRAYQTVDTPQLVVVTNASDNRTKAWTRDDSPSPTEEESHSLTYNATAPLDNNVKGQKGGMIPKSITLKDLDPTTDILEETQLAMPPAQTQCSPSSGNTTHVKDDKEPLTALQQSIILLQCSQLMESRPQFDELTLEELNAYVSRCLILPKTDKVQDDSETLSANWLVYSSALWFRSKAERHRAKTAERSCLQLQALIDQFDDTTPGPADRLLYAHMVQYPMRWEAKLELGRRMAEIGSVVSASNMFKDMRMWEEAVDCLITAGRRSEALELLEARLKKRATPRLLCSMGDVTDDPSCYEKAWDLSSHRVGRAKRSLGHWYFKRGSLDKAIGAYAAALEINPTHASCWFIKGCCEMKLKRWSDSLDSFGRVVSIDPEQGEAWANMAATHIQNESWEEAKLCVSEAVRRKREDWRIWDSYMKVCVKTKDPATVVLCLRQLVSLGREKEFPTWALEYVVASILTTNPNPATVTNNHPMEQASETLTLLPSSTLASSALSLFKEDIITRISDNPEIFRLYSDVLLFVGREKEAFQVRMSEFRTLQANFTTCNDHNLAKCIKQQKQCCHALAVLLRRIWIQEDSSTESGATVQRWVSDLVLGFKSLISRLKTSHPNEVEAVEAMEEALGVVQSLVVDSCR